MVDELDFAEHALAETLRLLALDPEGQVAALPDYVAVADELALTWSDVEITLDRLVADHQVEEAARCEALDEISVFFEERSGEEHAAWWTTEAVERDEGWETVRLLARAALSRLGLEQRAPLLDWISYVPGSGPE